jgi:hypothetical protein
MMRFPLKLAMTLVFSCFYLQAAQAQTGSEEDAASYADAGQKALAAGQYARAQSRT